MSATLAVFVALVIGVHDGDTVKVQTDAGEIQSIRLAAIDAPELAQRWGRVSGASLRRLCLNRRAIVTPATVDRYGRTVARVRCGRADASRHQVERGMAWVFRRYEPDDSPLLTLQTKAQFHRRGLWGDGYVVAPWLWRRQSK
jgi:micrococcal nuclease